MTNKVQKIREEVEKIARSINPYIPDEEGKNSEYEAGRFAMVTQIMQIIDTMQEEPVSEGLENAGKEWLRPQLDKCYKPYGEGKMMELTRFDGYAMLDAIEFGAKWQKEHLMKDAVDARCFGFQSGEALFSIKLPADKYLVGSEIKVVIIREDSV